MRAWPKLPSLIGQTEYHYRESPGIPLLKVNGYMSEYVVRTIASTISADFVPTHFAFRLLSTTEVHKVHHLGPVPTSTTNT